MSGLYSPWFFQQIRDDLGDPLSNGSLSTFETNSIIPKPVYTDFELLYPHPNPVPLDAAGYVPQYFLSSGAYTFVFKDRFGNVVRTSDKVYGVAGESGSVSAYVLPIASSTVLGGVKINGNGLAIDGSGVLSVISVSAEPFSLSAYATLSGSNFSGPVSAPSLSANSVSALTFETSGIKVFENGGLLKVEGKTGYYQDSGIYFGNDPRNNIRSVEGVLQIGGEDSYASFDGSNFYITSGNVTIGDSSVATNLGQKTLILNQQLQSNYRATFNSSAVVFDKFKSKQLITDSSGQLSGIEIASVAYDTGDSPRPLKYKIKSGAGIVITTATDGLNGVVMSINARGNNWTLVKNITAATYTVTDSDSTLINLNTNSIITLPTPSSLYDGRIITVRGGLLGSTTTVNSLGDIVGTPSVVITNYEKRDFLCYFNSVQWQWVITN